MVTTSFASSYAANAVAPPPPPGRLVLIVVAAGPLGARGFNQNAMNLTLIPGGSVFENFRAVVVFVTILSKFYPVSCVEADAPARKKSVSTITPVGLLR